MIKYVLIITASLCIAAAAWFGILNMVALKSENAELTMKLETAMETLEQVSEYNAKIMAATERLEQADAARQKQLRNFEKNLQKLAENNAETRALLDTVIPDELLHGLRSFDTARSQGLPIKDTGAFAYAP